MNQLNLNDPYLRYYANQAGSGVNNVYRGADYQRGHGIGSFLGGLFRTVTPLLKSGAKVLGKEALKTGLSVMGDIAYRVPPKVAVKNRAKELTQNLKRKADEKIESLMAGSGYKRRHKKVTVQSIAKLLNKKTRKRKVKRPVRRQQKRKTKKTNTRKKTSQKRNKRSTAYRDIFG